MSAFLCCGSAEKLSSSYKYDAVYIRYLHAWLSIVSSEKNIESPYIPGVALDISGLSKLWLWSVIGSEDLLDFPGQSVSI